jgi:hypothetical protein
MVPGDGLGLVESRPQRFSARRKVEIVLHLLRGEDLEILSGESNVTAAQLSEGREFDIRLFGFRDREEQHGFHVSSHYLFCLRTSLRRRTTRASST